MKLNKNIKQILRKLLPEFFIQLLSKYLFGRVNEVVWIHKMFEGRKGLMLDVGAHYGSSMRLFLNDDWEVHAFEPSDKNRKILSEQFRNNKRLFIHDFGLSDKAAENIDFYESDVSSGISSVIKFHQSHTISQKIKLDTLRNFLKLKNISKIDFLKIDAEGHDFAVLKGFPWEEVRPEVILCEYEDKKTQPIGHNVKHIADYLEKLDYVVYISEWYPIVEYLQNHKWRKVFRYGEDKLNPESWGNVISIRCDLAVSYSKHLNLKKLN